MDTRTVLLEILISFTSFTRGILLEASISSISFAGGVLLDNINIVLLEISLDSIDIMILLDSITRGIAREYRYH